MFVWKKLYKEAQLAARKATVKEYAQEISSLKATTIELMKRVEAMEKEHVVNNQSVNIEVITLLSMYIFTH